MNGPNVLSLSRMLLAIPLFLALRSDQTAAAGVALCAALLTDLLDGWWARRSGQSTELGRLLDPLADKILVAAALLALTAAGRIPREFTVVVLTRDVALLGFTSVRLRHGVRIPEATPVGKAAFAVLGVYLVGVVLGAAWPTVVTVGVGALYGAAGLLYARRLPRLSFARVLKEER